MAEHGWESKTKNTKGIESKTHTRTKSTWQTPPQGIPTMDCGGFSHYPVNLEDERHEPAEAALDSMTELMNKKRWQQQNEKASLKQYRAYEITSDMYTHY